MDTLYANVAVINGEPQGVITSADNWLANVSVLQKEGDVTEVHMCAIAVTDRPTEEEMRRAEDWIDTHMGCSTCL